MKYLSHVDGLRAVAVIPVILFHANQSWCPGGFIGVDIFFVISGFLITKVIIREIGQDNFSILRFYERRFRRIFPALFAVIFAIIIAGWFILLPYNFKELGQSVIASSLSLANHHFWYESGYFDPVSDYKPLLHLWSLSVEEQFYVFYPLLLILLNKKARKHTFAIIILLTTLSLGISLYGTYTSPSATFYFLPTRAWELALGGLIAFALMHYQNFAPLINSSRIKNWVSLTGIIMVFTPMITLTKSSHFPGFAALAPCLGTALILICESSFISKVLSWRPLVFTGKISYSLYLWHWPVFVLTRHYMGDEPSDIHIIISVFLVVLISAISWKFIEQPFRGNGLFGSISQNKILGYGIFLIVFFSCLGSILIINEGFKSRFPRYINELAYPDQYPYGEVDLNAPVPIVGANVPPRFALWGDSHAMAISGAFSRLADDFNQSCKIYTKSLHPPILGVEYNNINQHIKAKKIIDEIIKDPTLEYVIMHSQWDYLFVENNPKLKIHSDEKSIIKLLQNTVEILINNGKNVVLVYPVPRFSFDPKFKIPRMAIKGHKINSLVSIYKDEIHLSTESLNQIKDHPSLTRIYPLELLDKNGMSLITTEDKKLIYRDSGHLSESGAMFIMRLFVPFFENSK